ncbi:hypothetical protein [Bacillus phage vB_BanS-Thrax3]|nr:hypothetical protein [Bacillus phage vB_BanS-Thrax3]
MSKTVLLHVSGGDYSALNFEQNFNAQETYEEMVANNEILRFYDTDEYYIEVRIREFKDAIDGDFISYLFEELIDYDSAKHTNFYIVEGVK